MLAKQLSVFIENRQGRLQEVLNVLKEQNVNILSLSLADTTEYGLLRLIVDNPSRGKEELSKQGLSTMISDVLVVEINNIVGSLQKILEILTNENINIEYMYGLSVAGSNAAIAMKTSDNVQAEKALGLNSIKTLSNAEILSCKN